ncbi:hypothetical protein IMSHALPRED_001499 [Imshaugia aleurites]|uniref:Uncharacterized protein n=1 Tax=Imshaugia aleurites TaxID=172621 RepID=A0A8H3EYZ1_9LECA|nr:hypothetical protein IMSHALPRED_001499 [Imshaugia aleurites]
MTDGKPEAYFRGRKLRGREIDVPQGYRGVIVKEAGKEKTAFQNPDKGDMEGEEGAEEEEEEVTVLNEVGSFNEVVVWNHEGMADGDDAFVKGMSEWIGFAKAMHAPGEQKNS